LATIEGSAAEEERVGAAGRETVEAIEAFGAFEVVSSMTIKMC
jgi:hypothetical protein